MGTNVNLIKGLELVNVTKESMLKSHTPGEYIVAGLTILVLLFLLVFMLISVIKNYKRHKKVYGKDFAKDCGDSFCMAFIGVMLAISLVAAWLTVDIGVRDIKAQNRGEENCIVLGKECSREVLEVKVDEEEVGEIGVGEFMGEFVRKYEIVEVGDNGVWKVVVRE